MDKRQKTILLIISLIISVWLIMNYFSLPFNQAQTMVSQELTLLGHVGGVTQTIFVQDQYAYLAESISLTILDVSNPATPTLVSKTRLSSTTIRDIYVVGDIAFLTTGSGGLKLVDVSDPYNPTLISETLVGFNTQGIYVMDNIAYVTIYNFDNGLKIVDVSDVNNPLELSSYPISGQAKNVYVADNIAYVANNTNLKLLDISNPIIPVEVGSYESRLCMKDVYVVGYTAYFVNCVGFGMLDVSNPAFPTELGWYDTPGNPEDIQMVGDIAYIADKNKGLRLINVAMSGTLSEQGFYNTLGFANKVYVVDNIAYVADETGLRLIDVTTVTSPTLVGTYNLPAYVTDLVVDSFIVYALDVRRGIATIDVTQKQKPFEIANYNIRPIGDRLDASHNLKRLVTVDNNAYLIKDPNLKIIDISDSQNLTEIASHNIKANGAIDIEDNIAYVGSWSGVKIMDISNPFSLTQLSIYPTGDTSFITDISVLNNKAYIIDSYTGLKILDVSDPTTPIQLGEYNVYLMEAAIYIDQDRAYIIDNWGNRLLILDVKNPISPTKIGFYEIPNPSYHPWSYDVYAEYNEVYIASGFGGLRVINVANPANPVEMAVYQIPNMSLKLAVTDNTIYVANERSGLFIFKRQNLITSQKTTPQIAQLGSPLTYTINVSNTYGITLTATITNQFSKLVNPTGTLTWESVLLPPDTEWLQEVVVNVNPDFGGILTNTVYVTTLEGVSRTDKHTTFVANPVLSITKQSQVQTVLSGQPISYTIQVTNSGNITLTVTVTDTLPVQIELADTSIGSTLLPSGTVIWSPINLAPQQSWIITYVITPTLGYIGYLTNTVQATALQGSQASATHTILVTKQKLYLPLILKN